MIEALKTAGAGLVAAPWWTEMAWPVAWALLGIVAIVVPLLLAVAYLTLGAQSCWAGCKTVPAPIVSARGGCCSRWPMA